MLWAIETFEVRWLTRWCPSGEMPDHLRRDLGNLLEIPADHLSEIRGCEWDADGSKINGIAWLEHLVLRRPFLWVEDEKGVGDRELAILDQLGLRSSYRPVNVTADPSSLDRLRNELRDLFGA